MQIHDAARPARGHGTGATIADPPLIGLDEDYIGDQLAHRGRFREMVAGGQSLWMRAGRSQGFVGRDGPRGDRGREAQLARFPMIALPGVDAGDRPVAQQFPCLLRGRPATRNQVPQVVRRGVAQRKAIGPCKNRRQAEIGRKILLLGEFERQKTGPRVADAKVGPRWAISPLTAASAPSWQVMKRNRGGGKGFDMALDSLDATARPARAVVTARPSPRRRESASGVAAPENDRMIGVPRGEDRDHGNLSAAEDFQHFRHVGRIVGPVGLQRHNAQPPQRFNDRGRSQLGSFIEMTRLAPTCRKVHEHGLRAGNARSEGASRSR